MPNIRDIRTRIRSVKSTRQITKAMKMVAAAKLRRAQERALASRSYAQMLVNVLRSTMSRADVNDPKTGRPCNPLLAVRPEQNILLVLVTGDRGLAGAFNSNVLKATTKFIDYFGDKNIDVLAIGRKGRDFLRRRYPAGKMGQERAGRVQIVGEHLSMLAKVDYESVNEIGERIAKEYMEEKFDSVYLVFNEFKSVIAQRLIAQRILPVQELGRREVALTEEFTVEERERMGEAARSAGISTKAPEPTPAETDASQFATQPVDYIYEQPPAEIFADLLPRYITFEIFQGLLESVAAENAARMTAMESASNNANDVIDSLTLTMNRARQATITKEIIEIVSGAAAL
ncbi:MAG TPA: ATP synthase F1 subunit gamma [Verrucomicrobiae bacterium]|jgi:F-type H+-transporting ATPase subunit gamma|nr:ATP synthase F1 subunit gamma [Verrucomicrobiae bacterium]